MKALLATLRKAIATYNAGYNAWYARVTAAPEGLTAEPQSQNSVLRYFCAVPNCNSGYVTEQGPSITRVDCDEHNAFTLHDTEEIVRGEQQVIRLSDKWRQHGVAPPPGRK